MINLIQFYDKDGILYVLNGSSIPQTAADHADRRVYDFLSQYCKETKLIEEIKVSCGGSDWTIENKVLDEAKLIAEARSRGIGVAFDDEDMKRRNAIKDE